jgi:hypothetical protein
MAIFDTISFPPTDFVTGNPTIDGWTDNEDPGVSAHFPESGYATGGRIAFAGGSLVPPVSFQCTQVQVGSGADVGLPSVAAGSYLAMGFFCTFDPTFDEADGICVAILPNFATKTHTSALRIDLLPNSTAGAGPASAVIDTIPGQATNYYARLNRDLFQLPTFWQGVGTNANPTDLTQIRWQSIAVNNCFAKCASWHPTTMSVNAAPAQTVASTGSFTLTAAADISHFPDAGNLTVPLMGGSTVTVTYTGRNLGMNQFTGCRVKPPGTPGGSVDPGPAIQLQDLSWSVELLVPTTAANGGGSWADLSGHFGLYVNLFRVSQYLPQPPATPHAGFLAAQYRFPLPDASATDQQYLTGFMDDRLYISEGWYGQATIPSITGTNDAQGVCFQNVADPASSVGVRHPPDMSLGLYVYGNGGPADNELVAQVKNTNPTNAATNVNAEFRFGKWGNPPTAFAQWDPATAHGATTPTVIASLAAGGGTGEITSEWSRANVSGSPYAGDICMWVRLDSPDTVDFAQDGVRHNTIFTDLSEYSADATISGTGYPPPTSGSNHNFVLMTHVRELVVRRGGDERIMAVAPVAGAAGGEEQVLGWYWVVESFRRTGLEFTVGKTTTEVIDPSPGQFGAFARHAGKDGDVFIGQVSGGGLRRNGSILELSVPHNGEVTVQAWLGAGPAGTLKPPPPPPPMGKGGGCLAQLLPFLKVFGTT